MREKLSQYVSLLFAGAADAEEIKQEILQNTLDRYDDLVSQGKSPEAAYRLAIAGIGDINEILGQESPAPARIENDHGKEPSPEQQALEKQRQKKRAVAIGFYIACPIPLFILSEFGMDTMGLCFTLILVAAATVLLMMNRSPEEKESGDQKAAEKRTPEVELRKSISNAISAVGLVAYLVVSFATGAWFITWAIFPITGAVNGLVRAILDLKEASNHEN